MIVRAAETAETAAQEESIQEPYIPEADQSEASRQEAAAIEKSTSETGESEAEPVESKDVETDVPSSDSSKKDTANTEQESSSAAESEGESADAEETAGSGEEESSASEGMTEEVSASETESSKDFSAEEIERPEKQEDTMATSQAAARNINLQVGGLIDGIINPGRVTAKDQYWGNGQTSLIYFGAYYSESGTNSPKLPTLYRVLDNASASKGNGTADSILLLSNRIRDAIPNRKNNVYITGSDVWSGSLLRKWLNATSYEDYKDMVNVNTDKYTRDGYLGTAFNDAERLCIMQTSKKEDTSDYGVAQYNYSSALANDKIFILSLGEIENENYGFYRYAPENITNKSIALVSSYYADAQEDYNQYQAYWLRTSYKLADGIYRGSQVCDGGYINYCYLSETRGVAPAFNLDRSKILFAMECSDNSPVTKTNETLAEIQNTTVNFWQLTMLDSDQQFQIGTNVKRDGNTITVPYTYKYAGTKETDATQISIMITDKARNIQGVKVLYYGKGKTEDGIKASGNVTFDLPSGFDYNGKDWHIYIFSEQVNGSRQTDFASVPAEISGSKINLTTISTINITGIDAPAGGKALDKTAVCAQADGIVETGEIPVSWEPSDAKAGFAADYTAKVMLTSKDGYKFTADTKATVNGNEALINYDENAKTLTISYKFPKTYKAKLIKINAPELPVDNGIVLSDLKTEINNINFVPIETEDEFVTSASVSWNTNGITAGANGTYDPEKKTEQTFKVPGTVTLRDNIINPNDISRNIELTVIVASIPAVEIKLDEPKGNAALPTTATCNKPGIAANPTVTWSPASEKAAFNTEYTATIRLNATDSFSYIPDTNATVNGRTAPTSYNSATKVMTVTWKFTTAKAKFIEALNAEVRVPNGTPLSGVIAEIAKVSEASVKTEDPAVTKAAVQWDTGKITQSSYDPLKKTRQTFTVDGTITLPAAIDQNSKSLSASLKVTVLSAQSAAFTLEAPVSGKAFPSKAESTAPGISGNQISVSWDTQEAAAGYNKAYKATISASVSQSFIFEDGMDATVNGNAAEIVNFNSATRVLTVTYAFPATAKAKLLKVKAPNPVKKPSGTTLNELIAAVGKKISIETEDIAVNEAEAAWKWDEVTPSVYDPSSSKEQKFAVNGTVALPVSIEQNGVSLNVQLAVTVSAEGSPFIELEQAKQKNPTSPEAVGYVTVTVRKQSLVYTGDPLCPPITVKYTYLEYDDNGLKSKRKQATLKENVDYSLSYRNNINVNDGKGADAPSVTINGIGDYSGTIRKTFVITPKKINGVSIDPIGDYVYDGRDFSGKILDSIVVKDGSHTLELGKDYTVVFLKGRGGTTASSVVGVWNQDTLMSAVIVANPQGNYQGTASKKQSFYVYGTYKDREDLTYSSGLSVEFKNNLSQNPLIYNGRPQKPSLIIKLNGSRLSASNYKLSYRNNIDAGTATVTVFGKNKCYGSRTYTFSILKKDFKDITVRMLPLIYYRSNAGDICPIVMEGSRILPQDAYTVEAEEISGIQFPKDPKKPNPKLKLTLTPSPNNTNYMPDTKKEITVTVSRRSLINRLNTKIVVGNAYLTPDAAVNGAKPDVSVSYNGEALREGTDYTVTFKNNKKIGKAQAIIAGMGVYSGKRTIKFTVISP